MKLYYCKWTENDVEGLRSSDGIVVLFAETNEEGDVLREIGVNEEGKIVHRFPSKFFRYGGHGLFDNQNVLISESSPLVTKEEFEYLWHKAEV
jgi:hypothetical protein